MNNIYEILKTSYEWDKEQLQYIILHTEGWNRLDFDYSFHKEKITKDEFNKRLMNSTLILRLHKE